ncbi:MAG TPA: non-homologous end-joining DNA ligase [Pyrinomonadaceae bacterium]|nr:non-homologous end-joining DNA ligase [Pyrinomonadaceae bacterium]
MDLKQLKNVSGARKAAMPEFVSPQLATLVKEAPRGNEWLHELKFDGYRLLCHLHRGHVRLWTRNRKDWTDKFPNVVKALQGLKVQSAILDAEVVAMDGSGRSSFQMLQQAIHKTAGKGLVLEIFDLIYIDGFNIQRTPLVERKRVLEEVVASLRSHTVVRYSDHVEGNGPKFLKQACDFGIEGIVSKLADSPYESTRSHSWQKVKCLRRQEFVIAGYTLSDKGLPFSSLVLGVYEKGKLIYAGRVGTGFSNKLRAELKKTLDRLVRPAKPFAEIPRDPDLRRAIWTEPKLVGEVEFSEWTNDNVIRHPSFQGLREDKKATEVVREEPV